MTSNTQFVYTPPEDRINQRKQMVDTIALKYGDFDPRILHALRTVPRHRFVGPAEAPYAYEDCALSLACGQTISQPFIVARMAELLDLSGDEKVLEVGAGSGYQAAVLSLLTKEVFAIEFHAELAGDAKDRLLRLGLDRVHVIHGDGKLGYSPAAPFDRILISCALHEVAPPEAWREQLAPGGILVFPHQEERGQVLTRFWAPKTDTPGWERQEVLDDVRFVPLL